ncbi:hypothetical protein Sjap_017816 [Stephania japonica]|uniref:Pectinesterase inhibitor domain-containing protein n=1 Tax=Stephania japonica TaxID=461633 RepID=A0AAP0I7B6_9MAGN
MRSWESYRFRPALLLLVTAAALVHNVHLSVATRPISNGTNNISAYASNHASIQGADHESLKQCSNRSRTLIIKAAEQALNISIAYGKDTIVVVHELIKSNKSCKDCLDGCLVKYHKAIYNLLDAVKALKKGGYRSVNLHAEAAAGDASTCEDGFADLSKKSPLTQRNQFFEDLCDLPLSLLSVLSVH